MRCCVLINTCVEMATPRAADLDRRSIACEDLRVRRVLSVPTLNVENATSSSLSTTGDVVVGDDLIVTDDASVGGDLTVAGLLRGGDASLAAADSVVANGAQTQISPSLVVDNWMVHRHRYTMTADATVIFVYNMVVFSTVSFDFDMTITRGSSTISFHGRQYFFQSGQTTQKGSLITHDPGGLAEVLTISEFGDTVRFTTSTLASGDVVTFSIRRSA